jgi:hypothetical protein
MFGNRDRIIKAHLRTRFLVTLKSGEAFDGLLIDADDRCLVLCDALAHSSEGSARVDGQVYVDRANVSFMQLAVVSGQVISA